MRQISAGTTWVYKLLLPAAMICLAVSACFDIATGGYLSSRGLLWNLVNLAIIIFTAGFAISWGRELKYVALDGQTLVVSGYFQTIRVPLQDVGHVWGGVRLLNNPAVYIAFRQLTPFGSRIAFMPTYYVLFDQHPIVQELTDLVREAKGLAS